MKNNMVGSQKNNSHRALWLAAFITGTGSWLSGVAGAEKIPPLAPEYDKNNNGFVQSKAQTEPGKAFERLRGAFEKQDINDHDDGLGPVYNAISCVDCHQNPITGSGSQVTVVRAGFHKKADKAANKKASFADPPGGSLRFQRAINPAVQVSVPEGKDLVHTLRLSLNILGDGLVECIPDEEILKVQEEQLKNHPEMLGARVIVPATKKLQQIEAGSSDPKLKLPHVHFTFDTVDRIGRFGWKCQLASLLDFSADAYFNEMGITSPIHDVENKSGNTDVSALDRGDSHPNDPSDPPAANLQAGQAPAGVKNPFGADVVRFANFMRSTKPHPQDMSKASDPVAAKQIANGKALFSQLKCAVCHHPDFKTGDATKELADFDVIKGVGTDDAEIIVGSGYELHPEALSNQIIEPYSDFLLHDIGTGDGIVQARQAVIPPRIAPKPLHKTAAQEKLDADSSGPLKGYIFSTREDILANQPKGEAVPQVELVNLVETANKMRTAPLWGLRTRSQLMHDGLSLSLRDAIDRHRNQAHSARLAFNLLDDEEQEALFAFLLTL